MELNKKNQDYEKPLIDNGPVSTASTLVAKNQKSNNYTFNADSLDLSNSIGADSILGRSTEGNNWAKTPQLSVPADDAKYTQKSPMSNYIRAMIIASAFYYMGYYYGIMNPMGTILAKEVFGKTTKPEIDAFNGNVNLYFCLGCNVSILLVGPIVDLLGRIRVIILVEATGLALVSLYLVENLTVLYVTRALDGALSGLLIGACSIALAEMFPREVTGFGGLFTYLSMTSFILLGWLTPTSSTTTR